MILSPKKRYLQIALNSNLREASNVIESLPLSDRIIIEAGTPLIKEFGYSAISELREMWLRKKLSTTEDNQSESPSGLISLLAKGVKAYLESTNLSYVKEDDNEKERRNKDKKNIEPYIVADLKCMDRGTREVEIATEHGASAATVLGAAPSETINSFIESCDEMRIDSMIDMMNIEFPFQVLKDLKKRPDVVVLHRGVDEEKFNPEKRIPLDHIQRIKGTYNDVLISVAGGDTIREVQRAVFNDADIVVVWKDFYESSNETSQLAQEFLKKIK